MSAANQKRPGNQKRIVFLTGTRADFGKIKSLLVRLQDDPAFELHLFVTGMHMLNKYGYTAKEVADGGFANIYRYINQNETDNMDTVLAKTIVGFSDYVREIAPDMVVVHGDRVEAMAGAIVGAMNNILVTHIEGGEVSGTIDELVRHAVSKLSHLHFVANTQAKMRLMQLGEQEDTVFVIGSPDIDIMASDTLPDIEEVQRYYEIGFNRYGIVLFHPVTTALDALPTQARLFVDSLIASDRDYVVIYPNNDDGSEIILREYTRLAGNRHFRVLPSMRFEYFLTLMKHTDFVIGNSSAGVREAPFYGLPSINVGSRQHNRAVAPTIINVDFDAAELRQAIERTRSIAVQPTAHFGAGGSDERFCEALRTPELWAVPKQKHFFDLIPWTLDEPS